MNVLDLNRSNPNLEKVSDAYILLISKPCPLRNISVEYHQKESENKTLFLNKITIV
jgi:hypothetical protein